MEELMRNKIDISLFSEIKLVETSPNQQFKISEYKMFRRDRNKHRSISCKTVNVDCKVTLIDLSIKSRK